MSRTVRLARCGIGIVALIAIFTMTASAQPNDTTLFLMVRAGPSLNEKIIQNSLREGLKLSGCTIDGEPVVRGVSNAAFDELEALINKTPVNPSPEAGEGVTIRPLPTREPMSEFRLKSAGQVLRKLTVTYKKAGPKDYVPSPPDKGEPLSLIIPGRYALRLEPDDEPLTYEATVSELGKKDDTLKDKWPARDRFFVITMKNFVGPRSELFKVIQDPKQVANPLENVRLGNDFVFVFANMESLAAVVEETISGNELIVQVPAPIGRNPRRVWMQFPLSEDQYKAARDQYRKFDSEELPREIRKNSTPITEDVLIDPKAEPKWIEIPDSGNGRSFLRRLPLKDLPGLVEKFPRVYRLIVWEFDAGKPEAIGIQHPTDGRVYLLEEELKSWPTALKRSLSKEK